MLTAMDTEYQEMFEKFVGPLEYRCQVCEDEDLSEIELLEKRLQELHEKGYRYMPISRSNPYVFTPSEKILSSEQVNEIFAQRLEVGNPDHIEALECHDFTGLHQLYDKLNGSPGSFWELQLEDTD